MVDQEAQESPPRNDEQESDDEGLGDCSPEPILLDAPDDSLPSGNDDEVNKMDLLPWNTS